MAAPIHPDGHGRFAVELDPGARDLLEHMCNELEALLSSDSPLLTRLFPPPYGDDQERNEGYAALAVPELIDGRIAGLTLLRETLRAEHLTSEELNVWMRVVNDMRLVLGTLLRVSDDHLPPDVPEELIDTMEVYEFLGYLIEIIVHALGSP